MSRQASRPPLRIRPVASRRLAIYLALVHAAVIAVAVPLPLPWQLRLGLILAALLGLVHGLAVHVLRLAPWAVVEAIWQPDGAWSLILGSGREVRARLLSSTYVSPGLVVLNFRCGRWRVRSLVLPRDAIDADQHRRLRARLRLAGLAPTPAPDRPT